MVRVPEQTAEKTAAEEQPTRPPLAHRRKAKRRLRLFQKVSTWQYMARTVSCFGTISSHQTEPQARGCKFTEFGVLKQGRRAVGAAAILVTWRPMRSVREPRRWYAGSRSGRHIGITVQVCTLIGSLLPRTVFLYGAVGKGLLDGPHRHAIHSACNVQGASVTCKGCRALHARYTACV